MPSLDGKGPMSQGSRTGRGLGNCSPVNEIQNNENMEQRPLGGGFFGRGMGRGLGRGLGRGMEEAVEMASAVVVLDEIGLGLIITRKVNG